MDVLQDAVSVVGHLDAEVLPHLLVPALRQVAQRDAPFDDVLLELEAEHDVHPVRHLVGLDPDQAGLDGVDAGVEAIEIDVGELLGIRLLQAGIEEPPERQAAADEVLPEPALRLVDAERARLAGRQPLEMPRLLVAVEAVAVLVHRREERLERVRVVVRRDPDVVATWTRRERVLGRVDPPAVGPVAEELDHLVREVTLAVGREVSVEERGVHLPLPQLGDQLHQRRLQLLEQRPHLGRRRLRLVVVEEDVVPLGGAIRNAVDVLELQLHDPLERRQERWEVRLGLRLHPDGPRLGGCSGHRRAERRRHVDRLLVVAAREPDQRGVVGIGLERVFERPQFVEKPAHSGVGEQLVRDALHRRRLVSPMAGAGERHHRLLVPREKPDDLVEVRDLGQPLLQPLEGVRHARHPTRAAEGSTLGSARP